MGAIFFRQFSDGPNPYLTLAGEEYVRPLSIGSDWNSIRIVVLCALTPVNPAAPANLTAVDFFIGVCNYGGGSFASSSCANAVGTGSYTGFVPGTWPYVAGPPASFTSDNTGWVMRVGGVITRAGSAFKTFPIPVIGRKWIYTVTLVKNVAAGAPGHISQSCATSTQDWRFVHVADLCDSAAGSPVIFIDGVSTTVAGTQSANGTPLFSDAAGPLNALNIYWNKAVAPMEIYGLAVSRLT